MLEIILQYIVDGLMVGTTYALVAMGLTMIFGMMDIINFAHGELYMIGAVLAYYLTSTLKLNFFLSLAVVVLLTFAFGAFLERILMRRIRNAPHAMTAAVTIGLSMFLANFVYFVMGPVPQSIKAPFPLKAIFLGPIMLTQSRIFAAGVTIFTIIATNYIIKHTKLGRAIRATIQDHMAASLAGVNTHKIYSFGFAYGTALAALAGVLLGAMFVVTPFMGESMLGKAWIVVIVGGLGNIPGAIFAAVIIGVTESLTAGLWNSSWANMVSFIIVIIVLLIKPQGLFGKATK
ncbi:MAG: branched-chain amino acid ABC transporter permease [Anaerolineaceae bacterium]|nr:branched-chain amino acid ABC transporter permease [Anaerolineaceae bacterium]